MILHEGDCHRGVCIHQRAIEDSAHVEGAIGARRVVEVEVERDIEQAQSAIITDERPQFTKVSAPVFADREELLAGNITHAVEPCHREVASHVFQRIHTQAVNTRCFEIPGSPFDQVIHDFGIGQVDVGAHQVVKVTELVIDVFVPLFTFEQPEPLAPGRFIPVGSVKTRPVPFKIRVRASTTWERESRPDLDLFRVADFNGAILLINRGCGHRF